MSRKFLTNIDLNANQLQKAVIHPLASDPGSGVAGQLYFNTTSKTLRIHDGTNWVDVSSGESISDAVANLLVAGDGIALTYDDGANTLTIDNTGVLSVAGSGVTGDISVTDDGNGNVTVAFPTDVTLPGDLVVTGDLTVNGDITTLNTQTLAVEDNVVVLNANVTGSPTLNAGIEVERGTSTNASILWNESTDKWYAGLAGTETEISLSGHTHSASDVTDFATAVDDEIDNYLTGSDSISVSSGAIDTTLATTSYLTKTGGLAVDISSVETKLVTDGFTKKATANLGNNSSTSFVVTHNFGTTDVIVNVYEVSTGDTVEPDISRTSTNAVTITFAGTAPTTNQYRAVVIG